MRILLLCKEQCRSILEKRHQDLAGRQVAAANGGGFPNEEQLHFSIGDGRVLVTRNRSDARKAGEQGRRDRGPGRTSSAS
jgi:hypothetical protein